MSSTFMIQEQIKRTIRLTIMRLGNSSTYNHEEIVMLLESKCN